MKLKNNIVFTTVITIYVVVTLLRLVFHQPWYDEALAWNIAQQMNLLDIIHLMRVEGHTFIWYLLLMPFAKADLWYPYPMLFINYIFALGSVIYMWKKAPFSNFTKIVVTFSFPFFILFPVVARCYSIGVLTLFLLAGLYKDKLKHPIIYSFLIILCANTSVMALIGASAFGFIFAFDLINETLKNNVSKKDFICSFSIMAAGACLILWQLGGSNSEIQGNGTDFIKNLSEYYISTKPLSNILAISGSILSAILLPVYLFRNKKALLFFLYTIGVMLFIFTQIYAGFTHHFVFFFVYALISYWICADENPQNTNLKRATEIAVTLIFLSHIFTFPSTAYVYIHSGSKYFADYILNDNNLKNGRIILYYPLDKKVLPYLRKYNTDVWFYCQGEKATYNSALHDSVICSPKGPKFYVSGWLSKSISKDKTNYSIMKITKETPLEGFIIEDRKRRIVFELYKDLNKTYGIFKTTEYDK